MKPDDYTRLKELAASLPQFSKWDDSDRFLFFCHFWNEATKRPLARLGDLSSLYEGVGLVPPQNFGGEVISLMRRGQISRTREGYVLKRGAKEMVLARLKGVKSLVKKGGVNYVDLGRVEELRAINNPRFDLKKLITLLSELNVNKDIRNNLSVIMNVRAVLDHVPPIFGFSTFKEVASNYGGRSFKASMDHLENSSRKIADACLHTPIRPKEVLPNATQVDFTNDLDVLLGEIVRLLK